MLSLDGRIVRRDKSPHPSLRADLPLKGRWEIAATIGTLYSVTEGVRDLGLRLGRHSLPPPLEGEVAA